MNEATDNTNDTSATPDVANGAAHIAVNSPTSDAPKPEVPKETGKGARKGTPAAAQVTPKAEAPKEVPPSPPAVVSPPPLRLRMKTWTDPTTGKRYLMPSAVMADPRLGTMHAYAMTDEDTKIVKLTPLEWNALPFFYFQEDGPAPRASARPIDVIP
jgi:hypothetical protein